MAQEVQTTLDYRAELNEIEWIWYQQRKVSDKMQVRDKKSNWVEALAANTSIKDVYWEVMVAGWTVTSNWGVVYEAKWDTIYIPESWAYLFEYIPATTYSQTSYYYTFRIKVDWKTLYSDRLALWDHERRITSLNLWRKNSITLTLEAEFSSTATIRPTLKIIKL